jgi:hypothetical protein
MRSCWCVCAVAARRTWSASPSTAASSAGGGGGAGGAGGGGDDPKRVAPLRIARRPREKPTPTDSDPLGQPSHRRCPTSGLPSSRCLGPQFAGPVAPAVPLQLQQSLLCTWVRRGFAPVLLGWFVPGGVGSGRWAAREAGFEKGQGCRRARGWAGLPCGLPAARQLPPRPSPGPHPMIPLPPRPSWVSGIRFNAGRISKNWV